MYVVIILQRWWRRVLRRRYIALITQYQISIADQRIDRSRTDLVPHLKSHGIETVIIHKAVNIAIPGNDNGIVMVNLIVPVNYPSTLYFSGILKRMMWYFKDGGVVF